MKDWLCTGRRHLWPLHVTTYTVLGPRKIIKLSRIPTAETEYYAFFLDKTQYFTYQIFTVDKNSCMKQILLPLKSLHVKAFRMSISLNSYTWTQILWLPKIYYKVNLYIIIYLRRKGRFRDLNTKVQIVTKMILFKYISYIFDENVVFFKDTEVWKFKKCYSVMDYLWRCKTRHVESWKHKWHLCLQ